MSARERAVCVLAEMLIADAVNRPGSPFQADKAGSLADWIVAQLEAAGIRLVLEDRVHPAAPFPTLALAKKLSPNDQRQLWLMLFATSAAHGTNATTAAAFATRTMGSLSALMTLRTRDLPEWLTLTDDDG